MKITSRQNAWFKRLREAIRDHAEEIVIEGPKPVADALSLGWTPLAIVRRGLDAAESEREFAFAPELFDALSETKNSQGVIGLFARPHSSAVELLARRDSILIALDAVQDPGNVGTIVRLAAAFDAAGVLVLPGCADPFGPKAIRASAGAILTVPVAPVTIVELIESGLPLFAADASGSPLPPPAHDAVLVFGNEGAGVAPELLAAATPLAIETSGRVESLNVAASAAILLSQSFALRKK